MKEKPGIGVVGVGVFGSLHAEIYKQMSNCRLKGIADVSPARLDRVASELGVDGYADYHDLLMNEEIDAVSICVTDELHVEPAVAAAAAGKHLLVEKPLALTPEDCDRIIAAAKGSGVKLMVGHILRFDPRYATAYHRIKDGTIGSLVHLFARRNNAISSANRLSGHTSVLFFLGIHDLDLLNWCVGRKPETVYAQAVSKVLQDTPDAVLALLTYPGGTVGSVEFSWVLPESYPRPLDARFEAVGTRGAIYVDGGSVPVSVAHQQFEQPELFYAPELFGNRIGILRDELAHFVHCVTHDHQPLVSGEDGKAAVEVACAIQRSYETGEPVAMPSYGD